MGSHAARAAASRASPLTARAATRENINNRGPPTRRRGATNARRIDDRDPTSMNEQVMQCTVKDCDECNVTATLPPCTSG